MTTPLPPQPKLRSIAVGILIGLVLVVVICSASSVVKWVAAPFLVLPRAVGLLEPVHSNEIVTVPMTSPPMVVTFPHAETYAVYVGDINLLETTNLMVDRQAPPWLVVQQSETSASIPVNYVQRGLLPFDEPRVPGRPVMTFTLPGPGTYVLTFPRRPFDFYLVPDRMTGEEGIIVAACIPQVALLLLPFALLYGRPWLERRRRWRAHQRERRAASDEVMRRRSAR